MALFEVNKFKSVLSMSFYLLVRAPWCLRAGPEAEEEEGQEEKGSVPVLGKPFLPEEELISEALLLELISLPLCPTTQHYHTAELRFHCTHIWGACVL